MSKSKTSADRLRESLEETNKSTSALKIAMESAGSLKRVQEQSERLSAFAASQIALNTDLARALEPVRFDAFGVNGAIRELLDAANAREISTRLLLGPIEDISRMASDSALHSALEMQQQMARIHADIAARFRMPALNETARLMAEMQARTGAALGAFASQDAAIKTAMQAMRTPWLDTANAIQSVHSFAALQDIGTTLARNTAFGDEVTSDLRRYLGDWRDAVVLPHDIADNVAARSAFYESRGFDADLTDFPNPAFEEAVTIAGLWEPVPIPSGAPDAHIPAPSPADEPGFDRTNRAHNRLVRFESHLRQFIDQAMYAAFGDDWIRHHVPGPIRDAWHEKQGKAKANGDVLRPLIEYADFTDYEVIIVRSDNWVRVFKSVFRRKESVRESFHRLYPIRLSTMHARLISQDDELYLLAEVKRLLKAIGVL